MEESEGVRQDDVWEIGRVPPVKQLYPTEKPARLLERIVAASSNEGDVVLDPFCGCGTAIIAAQLLKRSWIGIDITHLAVGLIRHRLADSFGPSVAGAYDVVGEPTTVGEAARLTKEDPFQFQAWALGLVGARTATSSKKGADKGIDGRLYFHDDPKGPTKQIIFSVKGGSLRPDDVRALGHVVTREGAQIGVLISLNEPTKNMRGDAAGAGFYKSSWGSHPKLQILTVGQLLGGARVDYPSTEGTNVTLKRTQRIRTPAGTPIALPLEMGDPNPNPDPYLSDDEDDGGF